MSQINTELFLEMKMILGEGIIFEPRNRTLQWIDIKGKTVYRSDLEGNLESRPLPLEPGTLVPDRQSPDLWLIALEDGVYRFSWATGEVSPFVEIEADMPSNRFNDGKCDPSGNLWAGTMDKGLKHGKGILYRVTPGGCVESLRYPVSISNGICFSTEKNEVYYIDTPTRAVQVFELTNRCRPGPLLRKLDFPEGIGSPDGMTIDSEGFLWVAFYAGGRVRRIDPETGEILLEVAIPAPNVTSATFGGDGLDILFVTTALENCTVEEMGAYPASGSVFKVTGLPGKGLPPFRFG